MNFDSGDITNLVLYFALSEIPDWSTKKTDDDDDDDEELAISGYNVLLVSFTAGIVIYLSYRMKRKAI